MLKRFAVVPAVLLVSACASSPPPPSLAQARTAIDSAQRAEADTYAPLDLRVAQDKLLAAQNAAREDDDTRADRLAREAIINAQLAQTKSESARAQASTQDLERSLNDLQAQIGGVSTPQSAQLPPANPGVTPAYPQQPQIPTPLLPPSSTPTIR